MDYSEEVNEFQLNLIDKLILEVTPDEAIAKAGELVTMAMTKDMTGAEKFEWVVDQVKPILYGILKLLAEKLVQLLYDIIMGYKDDLESGAVKELIDGTK